MNGKAWDLHRCHIVYEAKNQCKDKMLRKVAEKNEM